MTFLQQTSQIFGYVREECEIKQLLDYKKQRNNIRNKFFGTTISEQFFHTLCFVRTKILILIIDMYSIQTIAVKCIFVWMHCTAIIILRSFF